MNRVAILHYASPPVVGGVESTIYHHARLLAAAGYAVSVISGRGEAFHPQVDFHLVPELDSRHPEILAVGAELAAGRAGPRFTAATDALAARLGGLLAGASAAIVHNALTLHKNLPLTAALARLNAAGAARLVAWCHDFAWQDELYTQDLHPGEPWDLLRTPWPGVPYVAVSEHRRRRLAGLLGVPEKSIRVIPPGVDAAEFLGLPDPVPALAERLDLFAAEPLILLPARITRRKNIEFAVRVMAELAKRTPRPVLLITGPPGPHNPKNAAYLHALKDLCAELGLEGQVHFLYEHGAAGEVGEGGAAPSRLSPLHLPDAAIAGLYRLADLLLFPSLREGFGIPVLEAGLARLPVFAADIPPIRESAGEHAELFDPRGDPAAVAAAIAERLAGDRAHALRKRVLARFTWQQIVRNELIPLVTTDD